MIPTPTPTPTAAPVAGASPVPGYATTWVGNTFRGSGYSDDGTNSHPYLPPEGEAIAADSSGDVYLTTRYDEGHRLLSKWTNGKLDGSAAFYCLGWNSNVQGSYTVATNGTYVYVAVASEGPKSGNCPTCPANSIQRYDMNLGASTFSGATGNCTNETFIDNSSSTVTVNNWVYGLAASPTDLYVGDAYQNRILDYDANTMTLKGSFAFTDPGPLAYDAASGTLWILQPSTKTIYHYNTAGNRLSGTITGIADPTYVAIQPSTGDLWVTDSGPDQDIKIFNSSGTQVDTFGQVGGVYANVEGGAGVIAPDKLLYPRSVAFGGSGDVFTLGAGNWFQDDLRAFDSTGAELWKVYGFGYVESAVADPSTDGDDVYTPFQHFTMNYNNLSTGTGGGGVEESWTGVTMNPFAYPGDPRLYGANDFHIPNAVQNIGGHKYLTETTAYGHGLMLFRMNGMIAVPFAMFNDVYPGIPNEPSPPWLWQDANNDGYEQSSEFQSTSNLDGFSLTNFWVLDSAGNVWATKYGTGGGLIEFPMQGINASGDLTYSAASAVSYGIPAPLDAVGGVYYDAANDVMYLSGFTPSSHNTYAQYPTNTGDTLVRYNKWSAGNRTPAWTINLPWNSSTNTGIRPWTVAGGKIFAGLEQTENNGSDQVIHNIYVYDASSGALLGEMMPGAETNYFMGWLDCNNSLSAVLRSTGEYVVFEEGEITGKETVLRGLLKSFTQY